MGYLIAMTEQTTAKVEANTNALREGNKGCGEAMEACIEKVKAETDAGRKEMKADREATEVYP
jgi:hypothetical protein